MALSPLFVPVAYDSLPGWAEDDHAAAFAAFRLSAVQARLKPYRTGSLGADFASFSGACDEARGSALASRSDARSFFERHFAPFRVSPEPAAHGFVTGFYEPVVPASATQTAVFGVPLLARPDDLVDVDDGNRPEGLDPYFAFGRQSDTAIVEYFDRAAIEQGALRARNLEIAWVEDPVDAFFIHVQGSARLAMVDGSVRRVTYAAKTGHPFTGAGKVLAGLGEIPLADVTMQSIRRWFRQNPARVNEILWRNRSYIFFRDADVDDPALGPVAAAKVPLTPGRSVAVDRLLHTFGTPFFIQAPALRDFCGGGPLSRLMIAQDTGSAIVGAARGDLFTGSGFAAGEIAGVIKHAADFFALLPRALAGRT